MNKLFVVFFFFMVFTSFAQISPEEEEVKKVVTDLFGAFHKQDSVALRNLTHTTVTMQSIGDNAEGKTQLSTSSFENFLRSIVSIPSTTKFEEKLHGFEIHINGQLAQVTRSEEHTSELQSRENLVCRLLLEKKKKKNIYK